ncbi:MAG: hypothetical protein EPO68_01155 [Planctomycetota bacterium]|nr:MAG: hypothetical protein EPO68_01155 [Planctomycetota bacterium]
MLTTIVSDLLLTDCFLIKGRIENKYMRLSQMLDEHRKYFLRVRDATLVDLGTRDRIQTPLLHVNIEEVLLAHELVDAAGDPVRSRLAQDGEKWQKVRVFYTGGLNVEIAGEVRPGSYEITDRSSRRYFVMTSPKVRGMDFAGDKDLELLGKMQYAILNKARVSYVYDFN